MIRKWWWDLAMIKRHPDFPFLTWFRFIERMLLGANQEQPNHYNVCVSSTPFYYTKNVKFTKLGNS